MAKLSSLLIIFVLLSGCSKSGSPSIGELVVTRPPTFGGLANHSYTTTNPIYVLTGECDPISYGIEVSYDNSHWLTVPGGCSNGSFTLNFLVQPRKNVWARAVTKNGYSASGHAFVRLLLPPTSPAFSVAQAAAADEDGAGMQATMAINFDNRAGTNGLKKIFTDIVGIQYDK